ncbi:MAG: alanine/glycine:cation symporter family protein [Ornithinimicrobium sp.]
MLTPTLILPTQAVEPEGFFATIDSTVNDVFGPFNTFMADVVFWSPGFFPMPWIVMWLLAAAIIITVYLGFIQIRGIKTATEVIRGKFSSPDDPGEIPHYQALTSAVSGTVGLGNIAGVGAAMVIGGPGATFWMILAGIFGMATKFAECTLGVKYRTVYEDGSVSGGPFKYLPVAFNRMPKFVATGLTGIFAISILFFGVAGGNMFQANQTYSQAVEVTGGPDDSFLANSAGSIIFGLVLATIIGLVILGGIKSIGKVTSTLVPFMGGIYVLTCLFVIIADISNLGPAISSIVGGAFSPDALTGGFIGVLITGLQRAAFSNEAGLGSAPIAHSAVKTRRPVSEGFVALFEPFIDTVVICTMTALAIIIADTAFYTETREGISADPAFEYGGGVAVTSNAFESVISWFPYVLAVAVALFAISTLITWSYYGNKAWNYLFGESKTITTVYRIIFLFLTVTGCVLGFSEVLGLADSFLFVCGFINLLGVYFLLPSIKREMNEYLADRKSGVLYELGKEDQDKDVAADNL